MARSRVFSPIAALPSGSCTIVHFTRRRLALDENPSRGAGHERMARAVATAKAILERDMSSRESKLTSVVAEYERLGHRLRFSASA
jgi:hypothetical protein